MCEMHHLYDCEICGHVHEWEFNGECRADRRAWCMMMLRPDGTEHDVSYWTSMTINAHASLRISHRRRCNDSTDMDRTPLLTALCARRRGYPQA